MVWAPHSSREAIGEGEGTRVRVKIIFSVQTLSEG
jgi:hypothetical protein